MVQLLHVLSSNVSTRPLIIRARKPSIFSKLITRGLTVDGKSAGAGLIWNHDRHEVLTNVPDRYTAQTQLLYFRIIDFIAMNMHELSLS